ncbi:hypothetical protein ECML606-1_000088 [Escherichia phage ECML-606-1]|nr:hypothetical protein ECML606-1_000088 [Escherichia phage ECML-606-1]
MSRISQADKQRMYDLAVEIIEHKKNSPGDYMGACKLYDQTDEEWNAERIKSLLDELKNVTELACEWKQHAFVSRVASRLAVGDRVFSRDAKDEALAYAKDNGLTITPIWDEDEKTYEQHMEHWYGPTA